MKQHKWHKEIKAWADGAEIEFKASSGNWLQTETPDWNAKGWEYRIKPQPKEPQYLYVYKGIVGIYTSNDNSYIHTDDYIGKIKLEVEE